jgi:hypothetical protein
MKTILRKRGRHIVAGIGRRHFAARAVILYIAFVAAFNAWRE